MSANSTYATPPAGTAQPRAGRPHRDPDAARQAAAEDRTEAAEALQRSLDRRGQGGY